MSPIATVVRAALLVVVLATCAHGNVAQSARSQRTTCRLVQQVFQHGKRPVCLIFQRAGHAPFQTPGFPIAHKFLTGTWSYRCPATMRPAEFGFSYTEYDPKNVSKNLGDGNLGPIERFATGEYSTSGHGAKRIYTGNLIGKAIAFSILAGSLTEKRGIFRCTWHVTVTADDY